MGDQMASQVFLGFKGFFTESAGIRKLSLMRPLMCCKGVFAQEEPRAAWVVAVILWHRRSNLLFLFFLIFLSVSLPSSLSFLFLFQEAGARKYIYEKNTRFTIAPGKERSTHETNK